MGNWEVLQIDLVLKVSSRISGFGLRVLGDRSPGAEALKGLAESRGPQGSSSRSGITTKTCYTGPFRVVSLFLNPIVP